MDVNYFFGIDFTAFAPEPLRSRVSLHWALDLMCEKLMGVSNFPFLVVVSLKDPAFKTRSPYLLIPLFVFLTCAGISSLCCCYVSVRLRNSVTNELVLILWHHARARQNHTRMSGHRSRVFVKT